MTIEDPAAAVATPDPTTAADAAVVVSEPENGSTLLTDAAPAADADPAKDAASEAPDGEGENADAKNGAPEAYAEFALPEGVALDKSAVEAFAPIAKELNLTQEQAQKIVDLRAAQVKAEAAAWEQQVTEWAEQAKADPDIGGAKFADSLKAAQAAYVSVATPALRDMLDASGYGNHPEVIRMFAKLGQQFGLDKTPPAGNDPARGQRSLEERLYGTKA